MTGGSVRRAATSGRSFDLVTPEPWPQGISRQASMRISEVLRTLAGEFGDVSHSKLRFLEEQGLISPVRTPSGYRQYSPADVERLRFVLTQQRDSYTPLKVIKEQLAAMDAGTEEVRPVPRLAPHTSVASTTRRRWSPEQVAETAGVSSELVDELIYAGVLEPSASGMLTAESVDVARIAVVLAEHGIQPRHLRTLRSAAHRHVALIDQATAPWRGKNSSAAHGQAASMAGEIGELLTQLHAVWVRQGVANLL